MILVDKKGEGKRQNNISKQQKAKIKIQNTHRSSVQFKPLQRYDVKYNHIEGAILAKGLDKLHGRNRHPLSPKPTRSFLDFEFHIH